MKLTFQALNVLSTFLTFWLPKPYVLKWFVLMKKNVYAKYERSENSIKSQICNIKELQL